MTNIITYCNLLYITNIINCNCVNGVIVKKSEDVKLKFQQNKETLTTVNATGVAMLFSAGTFLYVATVHVLPELASMGTSRVVMSDGTVVVKEQKVRRRHARSYLYTCISWMGLNNQCFKLCI